MRTIKLNGDTKMVDFKKKIALKSKSKITNPIELYNTLDRKSIAGPLRPVQEYALDEWYNNRKDERDLIVKLHTGEGKTLIGLLMLLSSVNLGEGPCVYVCPNIYLVKQVCDEAEKFGIPFCVIDRNNTIPNEFLSGEKMLITHAHKIFNGKSIFGIGNSCTKAGTIVLDDSHACIDVLKNSFTITISRENNEIIYNKILTLFSDDLIEQGEGSYLDVKAGEYDTFMMVPYWAWNSKRMELLSILSEYSSIDEIQFVWPLMKDKIIEYSCFVSGNKIEITWESDKEFKNRKGVYYISRKLFEEEVLKFIEIMFERREIVEQKLDLVVINGKKISAKRNYDTEMEFEDQMLEELKNVNYNLKTVYELIHMTEKDRIIVPIILKYIKLTNNIYDKANLIRFLGIKGLFEALPDLEEQLKGEDNLDIKAAILNTISVIKK